MNPIIRITFRVFIPIPKPDEFTSDVIIIEDRALSNVFTDTFTNSFHSSKSSTLPIFSMIVHGDALRQMINRNSATVFDFAAEFGLSYEVVSGEFGFTSFYRFFIVLSFNPSIAYS